MSNHILSPLPGIFYRRPTPEEPPYKEAGDTVAKGDVVGLVEVMKTFYEVKAEGDGKIVKFLIENDYPVQAGDPLVELES